MKTLLFLLLIFPGFTHAAIFDMGEHSGIIKDSTGNFYKVNSAGTVSAIKTGTDLALTEKVNIPTSKGFFSVDIPRNVPVEVSRMGKAVRTVAVASGPVGMAVTAVSLICELTSICDEAGTWMKQATEGSTVVTSQPNCQVISGTGTYTYYESWIPGWRQWKRQMNANCGGTTPSGWGVVISCNDGESVFNCPFGDKIIVTQTSTPTQPPASIPGGAPSSADWDSKESLMNDARFIDPLMEKNQPVPVGAPSLASPVNVSIGSETKTIKDGSGNTTGTETLTTEAQISQPTSAENPTGSPSAIKILESVTNNTYNTSNQLISSTTTVSDNPVPVQQQQQQEQITITIDDVPDVPLQTVEVPGTFSFTSWGSGSCPADKSWNTMFGTHQFSYQLTCDFAGMAKPIILLIAAIVSIMIVASIRTDT